MKLGVMILVLNQDEMVLLGRHQTVLAKTEYCSPSGFVRPDETFLEAAQREVLEEIGVTITAPQLQLFAITHDVSDQKLWFDLVLHINADEIITSAQQDGWEWHVWESLPKPLYHLTEQSLTKYQQFLKKRKVILA